MKWVAALLLLVSPAFADSLTAGAGKLLNNVSGSAPGYLWDLTYTHPTSAGDVQLSVTEVEQDVIADHTLNVSLTLLEHWKRLSGGVGLILSQAYSVPQWWINDKDQPFVHEHGWGKTGQCTLCGIAVQAGFDVTPKWQLQARYWSTQHYLIPPQNGVMLILTYRFKG